MERITITPKEIITLLTLPTSPTKLSVIVFPIVPVSPLNTVTIIVIAIVSIKYCNIFVPITLLSSSHATCTAAAKIASGIIYCIHPIAFSRCGIMF